MATSEPTGELNHDRRRFLSLAAGAVAATQLGLTDPATAASGTGGPDEGVADLGEGPAESAAAAPATNTSFGPVKQVEAGVLDVGYVEAGPADGRAVILMHGFPYDIHSYVEVAPLLAAKGYRVIAPYFRGHGTTRFRSGATFRNAQQSVFALDVIALMDALKIHRAVLAGYDWGSRTGDIIAALWPQRCRALVSVTGYLISNVAANKLPLPPKDEWAWWYQYYFTTERGVLGLTRYRRDLAKLIWRFNSPQWHFDDATFERTAAAFENRDYVRIVIHNYRWRLGLARGEPRYDGLERRLFERPVIAVPTITVDGESDPFTPPGNGSAYRHRFAGKYEHRVVKAGHNVPQEAPHAFAQAVVDVDHF